MTAKLKLSSEMEALMAYEDRRFGVLKFDLENTENVTIIKKSENASHITLAVNVKEGNVERTRTVSVPKKTNTPILTEEETSSSDGENTSGTGEDTSEHNEDDKGSSTTENDASTNGSDSQSTSTDSGSVTKPDSADTSAEKPNPITGTTTPQPNRPEQPTLEVNGVKLGNPATSREAANLLGNYGLIVTTNDGRYTVINDTSAPVDIIYYNNGGEDVPEHLGANETIVVNNNKRKNGDYYEATVLNATSENNYNQVVLNERLYDVYLGTSHLGTVSPDQLAVTLSPYNIAVQHVENNTYQLYNNNYENKVVIRLRVNGADRNYVWSGKFENISEAVAIGPWLTLLLNMTTVPLAE